MPCHDTRSRLIVTLDPEDQLVDFDFYKNTCSKAIGGETGYRDRVRGKGPEEIFAIDFDRLQAEIQIPDPDDQFFLFLEWQALRAALSLYRGYDRNVDTSRYQLSAVCHDATGTELRLTILPPKEMPKKIKPCHAQESATTRSLPMVRN